MALLETESDTTLLALARDGSGESFAVFYRRYSELVLGFFARRVASPEAAADLTMEVFAAALLATRRASSPVPEHPSAWLFAVARNKLADSYRRGYVEATMRARLQTEAVALDDDDIARINELTDEDRIMELLQALPPDQREAVQASIIDDERHTVTAARLGCSALVVRQRASRGLRALRGALQR